jgi:hypothetical protein
MVLQSYKPVLAAVACAGLLAGSDAASASADPAHQKKRCTRAKQRHKPRLCGGAGPVGSRFRFVSFAATETLTLSRTGAGEGNFSGSGTASLTSARGFAGDVAIKDPRKAPVSMLQGGPVTFAASSHGSWTHPDGHVEDCSLIAPPEAAPAQTGGAFVPLRNGGVEVSWSLAGAGFACPESPPPVPEAFGALPVSRYPASKFKGARVTLPIDYRVSVADAELGITGTLRWTGKAVLARVGG